MKPKFLKIDEWNKLLRKYEYLSLKNWNNLDGLKKIALLKGAKISINPYPIFGTFENEIAKIYNFDKCITHFFNITELNRMRHIALEERKEIGGIIEFNFEGKDIIFKIKGSENRIDLYNIDENKNKNLTVFHTHPQDEDIEYDPPSVLDIISFLEFNVKSIADRILNKNVGELLKIQNSVIFTKNEVYVCYLSDLLVINIVKYLLKMTDVYEIEKLLEEIEIYYSYLLKRFNMELNNLQINEYISYLKNLGFIIERYKYIDEVKIYKY